MGYKGTIGKTNWALGEISPRSQGRFDADKPIWKNGAAIIENMLIGQACSVSNRPGTQYVANTKFSTTAQSCLKRFTYSIAQEYMMELGNQYIRFFSNIAGSPGQVVVSSAGAWATGTVYSVGNYVSQNGLIYYCINAHTSGAFATDLASGNWVSQNVLEIPTIFQQADIFNLQTANKNDVMYIVNQNYFPQKLTRTSATSFTIQNVPFVRGPFMDGNITGTTITPSAATNGSLSGQTYAVGNLVSYNGSVYRCIVNNTAGISFAADLASGYWQLVDLTALWFSTTNYTLGQVVNYNGNIYYCTQANINQPPTNTQTIPGTSGWQPIVVGGITLDFSNYRVYTTSPTQIIQVLNTPYWQIISATPAWISSGVVGITLTASTAIFQQGHVGSLWWMYNNAPWVDSNGNPLWAGGVVNITGYISSTQVSGTIQNEPDGTAGNLGSTAATTKWSEGAFSQVRGFPSAVCFHEGRLVYGKDQTLYGSVVDTFDDFCSGSATDSDAYQYQISSTQANGIRWIADDTALEVGTSGGTITAADGSTAVGISPTAPPNITFDNNYGVMAIEPVMLGGYLFYVQANSFYIKQLTYDLITSKYKSVNMMVLADHILRDGLGITQIASQIAPYDRIWAVRKDGQLAAFMRDPEQQVEGWSRIVGGTSDGIIPDGLPGMFESIDIVPIDGNDDQIWVICNRKINGVFQRFVEIITPEIFNNYWEPVRMDASLTFNSTLSITNIASTGYMLDDAGNIMYDDAGNPMMG